MSDIDCPCGSGKSYTACCEIFHLKNNAAIAQTAETLMRSRYSAYVMEREDYLLQTWHPSTRPAQLNLQQEGNVKWLGLKIIRSETETVEFVARYKVAGKATRLHEISTFVYEQGRWFYLAGQKGGE